MKLFHCAHKCMCHHCLCKLIIENNQISTNMRLEEQIVVCSYKGVLPSNKSECPSASLLAWINITNAMLCDKRKREKSVQHDTTHICVSMQTMLWTVRNKCLQHRILWCRDSKHRLWAQVWVLTLPPAGVWHCQSCHLTMSHFHYL